jgi:hypothetical protein
MLLVLLSCIRASLAVDRGDLLWPAGGYAILLFYNTRDGSPGRLRLCSSTRATRSMVRDDAVISLDALMPAMLDTMV